MKILFAAASLAVLSPLLRAAPAAEPAPVDAAAAVPRLEYRSVFDDTPTGVEQESLPWKKANADVAEFPRGHIDLLKWEQRQAAPNAPASTPAPGAPPAPQPAGAGHHRH